LEGFGPPSPEPKGHRKLVLPCRKRGREPVGVEGDRVSLHFRMPTSPTPSLSALWVKIS
jgi:hypothetical protein